MYQFLTSKGNAGSLALFRREESGDQKGNHQWMSASVLYQFPTDNNHESIRDYFPLCKNWEWVYGSYSERERGKLLVSIVPHPPLNYADA